MDAQTIDSTQANSGALAAIQEPLVAAASHHPGWVEGGRSRGGMPGTKGKKRILPLPTPAPATPIAHRKAPERLNNGVR
jgi:hypothetical protein